MARSKSSGRWLREHHSDPHVLDARRQGYRSRAAFKLLEIQEKDRIFAPGMRVVDLGAAPGGWSQVAADLVGDRGRVFACDILPMDPLPGVEFVEGDFTEQAVCDRLTESLDGAPVDLVISDMAPNISGVAAVDQPRVMYLAELAFDFAEAMLKPGGDFLVKVFQGEGFPAYLGSLKQRFRSVRSRKPEASRARSSELYLLSRGFIGG